jgi:DNA-binding NarL/FixJ family response regulator
MSVVVEEGPSLLKWDYQDLGKASARILLVDDFEPFRQLTALVLEKHSGYKIVAEAVDGPEGVQKASESQPDLVVLDLDLPRLGGIEVARQIRVCSPDSRILFLSASNDPALICEALHTGARGYVLKFDAVTDLVQAANSVLLGKGFISPRLKERGIAADF